ncbi:MAG: gliding motility lipoprotein GldH [Bacteroidetes bacterium]|nr:gliding motility lipoprotein GldH [Bacteroidota bacterium]MDA1119637.1 gliding motility lipoprotein GldH [Bacteroidota bacterium]
MKFLTQILITCLLFGVFSCDSSRVYEENAVLETPYWVKGQSLEFQFAIDDKSSNHDLIFNIRNSLSYPFQNIYIQYILSDSLNQEMMAEMKEFYLFDQKTGEPLGDGLGDLFDNSFPLYEGYSFKNTGRYSIKLEQFMRIDSLPMILSVGIRVQKSEQ